MNDNKLPKHVVQVAALLMASVSRNSAAIIKVKKPDGKQGWFIGHSFEEGGRESLIPLAE